MCGEFVSADHNDRDANKRSSGGGGSDISSIIVRRRMRSLVLFLSSAGWLARSNDCFHKQMGDSPKRKEQDTCGRAHTQTRSSIIDRRRRRSLLWMRILQGIPMCVCDAVAAAPHKRKRERARS